MSEFLRRPQHRYEDPLARVWIACAERIGFRVVRTSEAYATYDGHGTIGVGSDALLDPDDSLAQMIFHELCHALIEGDEGLQLPDWGLDNTSERHVWREHACLRLQAHLAGSVGLRDFFAPTTDFRVDFWQVLEADPFAAPASAGGRREPSCVAARIGAWRASRAPWAPHLDQALATSAAIAAVVPHHTRADDSNDRARTSHSEGTAVSTRDDLRWQSLWTTVAESPARHPAGHAPIARYFDDTAACASCAWSFVQRGKVRCRHSPRVPLPEQAPACTRWEPALNLDCGDCGACCREAYQAVELSPRELILKRHPELIVADRGRLCLRREGNRCAALHGGHLPRETYYCAVYDDRPRTCREFERGSAHCLDARRRVGLSL